MHFCQRHGFGNIPQFPLGPWDDRDTGLNHALTGLGLVPHAAQHLNARPR